MKSTHYEQRRESFEMHYLDKNILKKEDPLAELTGSNVGTIGTKVDIFIDN